VKAVRVVVELLIVRGCGGRAVRCRAVSPGLEPWPGLVVVNEVLLLAWGQ
jgi:hypothetical protein